MKFQLLLLLVTLSRLNINDEIQRLRNIAINFIKKGINQNTL